jgi:hypothetical protein
MSLVNFEVKSGNLSPELLLLALEQVIPSETISKAIIDTSSLQRRQRILPTHIVVALVIAMSFWSRDSIVDVFKNLIQGISGQLISLLLRIKTPTSSSITEARQRVGPGVMTRLFEMVAKPLATIETPGAFLGELRMIGLDGTVMDVPDTEGNVKVFGYPGSRPGTYAGFPKVRLVLLVELGVELAKLSPNAN